MLGTNEDQRPAQEPTKAVNILLMGADNPQRLVKKPTVAALLEDGEWDPGAYRSDTMMVVHIPADRKAAYIVSVPRDSYVPIFDAEGNEHDRNKINESFSEYGPFGTLRTIENLSGVRLNHLAVIDYAGFNDLTTAIGGVDVYIPETVEDTQQDVTWEQGWTHLEGERALQYVRTRHGLLEGDFDRIDRQQNFLRAVLRKTLADGTIGNPFKLTDVLSAISTHLAVDGDWSTKDIRSLAISLRGIDASKVRFMTLPLLRYQDIPGVGSSNIIDTQAAKLLWKAVLDDKVGPYLKKHPAGRAAGRQGSQLGSTARGREPDLEPVRLRPSPRRSRSTPPAWRRSPRAARRTGRGRARPGRRRRRASAPRRRRARRGG